MGAALVTEKTNEPKSPKLQKAKRILTKVKRFLYSQRGWVFITPMLILMGIFTFYPIIGSLITAFKNNYYELDKSYDGYGFENFITIIKSNTAVGANFGKCLQNTLIFAFVSVPTSIILALLISVGLNSIKKLQKLYQTIYFLPYLTNSLAMGAVFATFFNVVGTDSHIETYGLVNDFLMLLGLKPLNWTAAYMFGEGFNPWLGRIVVCIFEIWSGLPFKILLLFSAIQGVNKQYYDAAKVDGASKPTTLWKITVPLVSPTLSYLLITGLMGGMKSYSSVVGLFGEFMGPTSDYPMGTMVGYIYACIGEGKLGYAAAGSLILFAIIMVFTAINLWISKKKVHY